MNPKRPSEPVGLASGATSAMVGLAPIDVRLDEELWPVASELARFLAADGLSCNPPGPSADAPDETALPIRLVGPGITDAAPDEARRIVLARPDEEAAAIAAVKAGAFDYVLLDRLRHLPLVVRRAAADILAQRRITALARTDPLTGLANRTALAERISQATAAARRDGARFAVHVLDLDNFKDINDTLGHLAGDRLLITVAERLRGCVRGTDLAARIGGDEFALLQAHVADPADCGTLAAKLLASLAAPVTLQGTERHITASIGIALHSAGDPSGEQMILEADLALYRAKDEGRNRFCFFAPELDLMVRERVSLAEDLRAALTRDELELWYQPQVLEPEGRIVGLEALLRWNHPTRGRLLPANFLPTAEKTRLLPAINLFVLDKVCRQIVNWREAGVPVVKMAINVAFGRFHPMEAFARQVTQVLAAHAISPRLLDFELAEASLTDPVRGGGIDLHHIQMLGVRLVADQFGHGPMTLDRLGVVGFAQLKIATRLVAGSAAAGRDAIILRGIVRLADELGVAVVATGVETAELLQRLASAGCRVMQGHYLSPPLDAASAAALLRRGTIGQESQAHPSAADDPHTPRRAPCPAPATGLSFDAVAALFERLPVPVCVYFADSRTIASFNNAFIALFGAPPGRFSDMDAFWAQTIPDPDRRRAVIAACMPDETGLLQPGPGPEACEAELFCDTGISRRLEIRAARCEQLCILAFIDITAFSTRAARGDILSLFGTITAFLTRRIFLERARLEIRKAATGPAPLSLIMFDLDRFRAINDRYGHVICDKVLQALPDAVRSCLRPGDLAGRIGGEEFMILLPGIPQDGALMVAERVRDSIQTLSIRSFECELIPVSASFGVAALLPGEMTIDTLIIRADTAMYRAKRSGGNMSVAADDASSAAA